ncbi:hypothetical protein BCR34DRAFT_386130 [Clohesyomyces aquaticus]|uniref:Uncharacterized protein n=1 Tax=Clohesyomyces aquaticus TaxID=1231657 RepID=A0A1Y1ZF68_9PLEO|nr:hypothetical protein BCR34DRAFT_386130 [Clohesyomyces aquaticus]
MALQSTDIENLIKVDPSPWNTMEALLSQFSLPRPVRAAINLTRLNTTSGRHIIYFCPFSQVTCLPTEKHSFRYKMHSIFALRGRNIFKAQTHTLTRMVYNLATASLLLTWTGFAASIVAPPDPSYWKAPYALRVISDDARLDGRTLVPQQYQGHTSTVYIDTKRNPEEAYTIYPSRDPWTGTGVAGELFEQQYHSNSNSTELVLIYGSKPQTASGTPLFVLNTDTGPGVTHVWPAGSTVVTWGGYMFVWDEEKERAILRYSGWNEGMRWIASFSTGSSYFVYQFNGTLPDPKAGWGSSVSSIVNSGIAIDLEVVPLWTILESGQ